MHKYAFYASTKTINITEREGGGERDYNKIQSKLKSGTVFS